uniref:Uncharacterized protein n=1 Tax=Anguilla anguilla TaxID=7936 RepID=A0A0E9XRS2_ANGAN
MFLLIQGLKCTFPLPTSPKGAATTDQHFSMLCNNSFGCHTTSG